MDHSLFVKNGVTGVVTELGVYSSTRLFPDPFKYLRVTSATGVDGFLPLAPVGSEFDSGLRYTEYATGTVYQVCAKSAVNVLSEFLTADNYVVFVDSVDSLYRGLRAVFEERVSVDGDEVVLVSPSKASGVTRLFCIGAGMQVKFCEYTLSTGYNGGFPSQLGGDDVLLGRGMTVNLLQPETYRLSFTNWMRGMDFTPDSVVKCSNFVVIGKDVELLSAPTGELDSLSFEALASSRSWCALYEGRIVTVSTAYPYLQERTEYFRDSVLNFRGSPKRHSYYELTMPHHSGIPVKEPRQQVPEKPPKMWVDKRVPTEGLGNEER